MSVSPLPPLLLRCRWSFDISSFFPSPSLYASLLSLLQRDERDRISKFYFFIDSKRALIGRLLILKFLHLALGHGVSEVKRSEYGKPYYVLDTPSHPEWSLRGIVPHGLQFNISHHGSFLFLAAEFQNVPLASEATMASVPSLKYPPPPLIGCDVADVEYPHREFIGEFFQSFDECFTSREWEYIADERLGEVKGEGEAKWKDRVKEWKRKEKEKGKESLLHSFPIAEKFKRDYFGFGNLHQFFTHWAHKEAIIKAMGTGLSFELLRIEFTYPKSVIDDIGSNVSNRLTKPMEVKFLELPADSRAAKAEKEREKRKKAKEKEKKDKSDEKTSSSSDALQLSVGSDVMTYDWRSLIWRFEYFQLDGSHLAVVGTGKTKEHIDAMKSFFDTNGIGVHFDENCISEEWKKYGFRSAHSIGGNSGNSGKTVECAMVNLTWRDLLPPGFKTDE